MGRLLSGTLRLPAARRRLERRRNAANPADAHGLSGKLTHVWGAPPQQRTSVCAALGSSMLADVADEGDEPLAWRPIGLAAGWLQPELESP